MASACGCAAAAAARSSPGGARRGEPAFPPERCIREKSERSPAMPAVKPSPARPVIDPLARGRDIRRTSRLRTSHDFARVRAGGRRATGRLLTLYALAADDERRVGFVAGRAVGGAVQRNRARRIMRAAWRSVESETSPAAVAMVARTGIDRTKSTEVASEMRTLLEAAGVLRSARP